jgi:hypothetical protein
VDYLQKDFRIVRLDLPGFGLSGPTHDKNYSKKSGLIQLTILQKNLRLILFQ